jgi:hypothetical protein
MMIPFSGSLVFGLDLKEIYLMGLTGFLLVSGGLTFCLGNNHN